MRKILISLLSVLFFATTLSVKAQTSYNITDSETLFKEIQTMYEQKAYAAVIPMLEKYLEQPKPAHLLDVDYMLSTSKYEMGDLNKLSLLEQHLEKHPDSPYANRIYALMASSHFFDENYHQALAFFNASRLDLLESDERDDMTYRLALSHLKTGNDKDAAIWFETLRMSSNRYTNDCNYYISYIRYTQGRYDEAIKGFLTLQTDSKYGALSNFYIADSYLLKNHPDKAEIVAQNALSAYPNHPKNAELHRILGQVNYIYQRYPKSITEFETYLKETTDSPQRNALYMLGMAYYQTQVYSKATENLGRSTTVDDALSQNAFLHMGMAYIQLADKNNARMAFEQAAASKANPIITEQAAYNYALCIHETSYSAFGESVTVFEQFLNDYPNSNYAEEISGYLVEVYMTTRSYRPALESINRISHPSAKILEAKQKILFQLGTQTFANASFIEALNYFNLSLEIGQYNQETKAETFYWRGESYYRLEKYGEAMRDFNSYLQTTRNRSSIMYALAHYNLGYINFHNKQYAQSREWFIKYTQLNKNMNESFTIADAHNRIGDTYFQNRQFDAAKQHYAEAESLGSKAGDYSFYQLALVSGLQRDYSGKITLLNRLVGKYPTSPYVVNAIYEKGRSYVQLKNNNQAIASFKELMGKFPQSPLARKAATEIGLLHYQAGNNEEAIRAYKDVAMSYPGSEEARLAMRDLKSLYVDQNRVDEFATLVSQIPGNIQFDASEQDSLTYVAAERIFMRGNIEQAKQSFNSYLQSFPDGAFQLGAHYYLCSIANKQGSYELILHHSDELLKYPNNPYLDQALVMRGEVQLKQGMFNDALASYKHLKEISTTPNHKQVAYSGILKSAVALQDDVETIQAASDVLAQEKIDPELKNEALYERANAYKKQKADQKAFEDYKILAKDTRIIYGAEAKFRVAEMLYNQQQYNEAESELLDFIDQSTPHAYWLARGFILLSDVNVALGKNIEARQYLLSLQQNYKGDPHIEDMIQSRLNKLTEE